MEPSPGYQVPVIKPEPGPGVTGTCSEYTGQLTDDCRTDPFIANRVLRPVSQEEGLSTGRFDSDRGGLCGTDTPRQNRPVGGGGVLT